ncbi:28433_t:CDS:2, partial [Dentiscutata erythropus]
MVYTDEPFVYVACGNTSNSSNSEQISTWKELQDANPNFPMIEENSINYVPETDICILFPIAKVTYTGEVHKNFKSDFRNEKEFYNDYCTEYGHFFVNKLLVGGRLIIRNFDNAKLDQVEDLKSHLAWAFYASRSLKENPMENVIVDDFLVFETSDNNIQSPKDLTKWMKSLYEDNVVEIISYEDVIPIFTLLDHHKINGFTKRLVPGITHKHKELTFKKWLSDTSSVNLLHWIDKFYFCHGVLVNQFGITFSKKCAIDFVKAPLITKHDCLYLQIIHPKTNIEESLLRQNMIYESDSIPFVDMTTSKTNDMNYFFIRHEIFKISLKPFKSYIKPHPEFIRAVKVALNSIRPYHALQDVFNEFGHLLPQTIILGRQLRKVSQKLNDSANNFPHEISLESPLRDDINKAFEELNMKFEYLTKSNGNILKLSQVYDWYAEYNNDHSLLDDVRTDQISPLYKILDKELQHQIEIILENRLNIRILLTGLTAVDMSKVINMSKKDLTEIQIRIDFNVHLNDDYFQVFGHVIDDDNKKLEGGNVRFDLFDYDGFSAFIILNQETAMNVKKPHVAWLIVGKPEKLGAFSSQHLKTNIDLHKMHVSVYPKTDLVYISLPYIMSENDVVLLISSFDPPLNNPPALSIKILKWTECVLCLKMTGINLDEEILKLTQLSLY